MAFTLEKVVPWGRSYDEYLAMFNLSESDLKKRILGCGDGPASFNCSMRHRGRSVISVDPVYEFSKLELQKRIDETFKVIMEQTSKNQNEFIWKHIPSVEVLGKIRMSAMKDFLSDYETGLTEGRYINAGLPILPFADSQFDMALCSHFLFLYSEHMSEDFHIQSIKELCRVAAEVRIFPLLELGARKSRHLDSVLECLHFDGLITSIRTVPYEFQKGGNEMLIVTTENQHA